MPRRTEPTLWVAYIAAHEEARGWVPLSRRDAQLLFHRVGGGRVSVALCDLVADGWLEVRNPTSVALANGYRLGPRITGSDRTTWFALGRALFAHDGLLHPYLGSPLLMRGSILATGFLVLALIDRAGGAISRRDLQTALAPLLSPSSVNKRIAFLRQAALLAPDGEPKLTVTWRERLTSLRTESVWSGSPSRRKTWSPSAKVATPPLRVRCTYATRMIPALRCRLMSAAWMAVS